MKPFKLTVLLLLLLPALAPAQKKNKKADALAVFNHARFVYVEAVDGDEFKPGLNPDDRLAIADVRDALQSWGRYTYTPEREKADLIFVVRKGRLAEGKGSVGVGGGPVGSRSQRGTQLPDQQDAQGTVVGLGGEVGSADDMLQVCQLNTNGKLSGPLWIHTFADGLNEPRLLLFAQFKQEVEKAYPSPPPNPPSKP